MLEKREWETKKPQIVLDSNEYIEIICKNETNPCNHVMKRSRREKENAFYYIKNKMHGDFNRRRPRSSL